MNRIASFLQFLAALVWALSAQGQVYRWTDPEGRVHFGDRPPPAMKERALDLSASYERHIPFSFNIIPVDYALPTETHAKVEVAVSKIYEIYRSRLRLAFRGDPSFDIRIFADEDAFTRYGDGLPIKGLASGYFSPERNEAVTWRQKSFDKLLEVITHEANHALSYHAFREVPPWLNEGLSEYFERMEVFGLAVVIPPNPEWDQLIKKKVRDGTITPLADYLGMNRRDWQFHNLSGNRSYAQAWSLVYFLMSTPEGTRLLGDMLESLSQTREDFSAVQVIEAGYVGGLGALQTDWHAWALGPKQAHHY